MTDDREQKPDPIAQSRAEWLASGDALSSKSELAQARKLEAEKAQLIQAIRQGMDQKQWNDLLPLVERYLQINPDSQNIRKLADRLRRRLAAEESAGPASLSKPADQDLTQGVLDDEKKVVTPDRLRRRLAAEESAVPPLLSKPADQDLTQGVLDDEKKVATPPPIETPGSGGVPVDPAPSGYSPPGYTLQNNEPAWLGDDVLSGGPPGAGDQLGRVQRGHSTTKESRWVSILTVAAVLLVALLGGVSWKMGLFQTAQIEETGPKNPKTKTPAQQERERKQRQIKFAAAIKAGLAAIKAEKVADAQQYLKTAQDFTDKSSTQNGQVQDLETKITNVVNLQNRLNAKKQAETNALNALTSAIRLATDHFSKEQFGPALTVINGLEDFATSDASAEEAKTPLQKKQRELSQLKGKIEKAQKSKKTFDDAIAAGNTAADRLNTGEATKQRDKATLLAGTLTNRQAQVTTLTTKINKLVFDDAIKQQDLALAVKLAPGIAGAGIKLTELKKEFHPTPHFSYRGNSIGEQFIPLPKELPGPGGAVEIKSGVANLGDIKFQHPDHANLLDLVLLVDSNSPLKLSKAPAAKSADGKSLFEWTVTEKKRKIAKLMLEQQSKGSPIFLLNFEWLEGAKRDDRELLKRGLVKVLHPAFTGEDEKKALISFFDRPGQPKPFDFTRTWLLPGTKKENGAISVPCMGENCFLSYRLEFRKEEIPPPGKLVSIPVPDGQAVFLQPDNGPLTWVKTVYTGDNILIQPKQEDRKQVFFKDEVGFDNPPLGKCRIEIPLIAVPPWLLPEVQTRIKDLAVKKRQSLDERAQLQSVEMFLKHGPLVKCFLWCTPGKYPGTGKVQGASLFLSTYNRPTYTLLHTDSLKRKTVHNDFERTKQGLEFLKRLTEADRRVLVNRFNPEAKDRKQKLTQHIDTYNYIWSQLDYFQTCFIAIEADHKAPPNFRLHVKFEREYPGHGRVVLFSAGSID